MKNISVVIPTFNGCHLLQESLPFIYGALNGTKSEIIVVDNGSSDSSLLWLKTQKVKIIALAKNYGFTKACNEGAKIAQNALILFLNNDCLIPPNLVADLAKFLETQKLVATQPVVYQLKRNEKNRKLLNKEELKNLSLGASIENIGYFVDLKFAKVITIKDRNSCFAQWNNRYLYGLSGTCLLIEKKTFLSIGGFDESFHSYLEDVDLFIRLEKAKVIFKPCLDCWCLHYHLSTSSKMGSYKYRQDLKNWIKIISKNYSWQQKLIFLPFLLIERFKNLSGLLKHLF